MDVTNIEPVDVEKVAEEFPQSRFRITNAPILNPGICVVCGSPGGDGRQFADFGKTQDWFGVFYLCTFCLAEVAKMMGFVPNVATEKFLKDRRELQEAMSSHIRELEGQVNAARVLLRNCHCDNSDQLSPDSVSDIVDVEVAEESDGSSDDDAESSSVEESGDVSETSVDAEGSDKPKRTRRAHSSS